MPNQPTDKPRNKGGRPRKIDLKEAVKMRREGHTILAIAARFRVWPNSVMDLMKRHGFLTTKPLDKALGVGEESGESASSLTCKES